MDYTASLHDADPAGASPWGASPSSSPQHHRTGFAPVTAPPPFGFETPSTNDGLSSEPEGLEGDVFGPPLAARPVSAQGDTGADVPESTPEATDRTDSQVSTHSTEGPPVFGHQQTQSDLPRTLPDQQVPPEDSTQPNPAAQLRKPPQLPPSSRLQAKITGLERTGKKDPILRFDVHTNLPRFRTTQYRDVRRLHSEFVKLAEHLISANPDAVVPAVPPPLTSAGAGTDEDEVRVKLLMQRWFNYVCSSDVLMRDDEMVLFVESDFGYSPMVKMKQPATGVRRKILKQFAPPPDDTPELQAARPIVKLFYLGTMDAGHKVDKMVRARRGLGLAESDFGVKLGSMNVQEPHTGLANAYRKLGKVVQTVGDYHAAQATAEATTIGDPFQYHSQDAFILKETLTNRQILTREFMQAQETTRSKLNSADRLKASSNVRREKVDEAISALEDARQNEAYLFQKTTKVTQNLMQERRKWFTRTASDLRQSIREFVTREIEAERRTLALLESVRPDIRSIDSSGGLSRLGRESHPTIRRASVAASQGPKGDSWSGVPRRTDNLNRNISASFMGNVVEEEGDEQGQRRATTAGGSGPGGLTGVAEEDDEDRVDARNAASRLAASTF